MQIWLFDFEIVVGEDCSSDRSREILINYQNKYPGKFKLLLQDKNIGAVQNQNLTLNACNGKYIALCEGDDYWTDPYKLQKQVSFLENNPEYVMCFANADIIDKDGNPLPTEEYRPLLTKDDYTIEDFILSERHIAPTATLVYRNLLEKPLPEFYKTILSGDIYLVIMIAHHGKTKCFKETLAIYRIHSGGITKSDYYINKGDEQKAVLYKQLNKLLNYKYDATFRKVLLDLTKARIMYGSRNLNLTGKLKNVIANTGDYFKYSDKINVKEILYYTTVLFFPWVLKAKK
jgi:glycosyltransferase involved in cell wall biosynthesis